MLRHYQRILDTCEPYLIARGNLHAGLDRSPMGLEVPDANLFDPQHMEGAPFINLVKRLDELAYAPIGLPMPDWAFYDCAMMPGTVFGFARRAGDLPPWARRTLSVPDDWTGLVPVSIFICIPMAHREAALVFTLCSVNQLAAGAAPEGLWRLTLAAGTQALGVHTIVGTAQWRSPQLGLYAGLGPLELLTAWTPAHDNPATCTFRVPVDETARQRLLRGDLIGPAGWDRYIDADDIEAMKELQDRIEEGWQVAVAGPAEIRGSETRVPLQIRNEGELFTADREVGFTRRFQG